MAWQVEFRAGVHLPQIGWWLDAHFPQRRSFVSHAHADHLARHGEILCSAGTSRLMRARMPGTRVEHVLPFGQTERLTADSAVTLHPAGHVFGSAQSLIEHERHGSLLYTGDFKLRPGRSAEPCATPRADVLIMETTFGRPQYVFPPTEEVLRDIAGFCHNCLEDGDTPVIFGYSLGKSQELLCGLAEARLPVMLHPQTLRLTRIYEELGIAFPPFRAFDAPELAGHVVICPPQSPGSAFLRQIPRRRTAVVTGWAMDPGAIYRYQCDAAFPLSDHADHPDLLRFVSAVQPRRVLTLHGFAQDFARELRERGIEAWAVGEANQLELGISVRAAGLSPAPPPPVETGPEPALPPDAFARFARVAEEIKATPRQREKVACLQAYLRGLPPADAGRAALFCTARPFPPSDGRSLALGWPVVKRAVLEIAQLTEADYRTASGRFADAGDAAAALLASGAPPVGRPSADKPARLTLTGLETWFGAVAGARGALARLDLVRSLLAGLSPAEAKYVTKIITGDLRIGLKDGLVEEAIAAAANQPVEAVREANLLAGDIAAVARAAREDNLGGISLRVFHPLQFMLASPEPSAAAILGRLAPPVWLEEKYDGIRCQVHRQGSRVELYSRDLKRITGQFPELARAAAELPGDFIADAELLAWRDGRPLPFAALQKRLGRKGDDFFLGAETPVCLMFYDLLWREGTSLLKRPLSERRAALAALLALPDAASRPLLLLAPVHTADDAAGIDAAFRAARRRGNEGLMAKDPGSPYTPGRRGSVWLKLKQASATLDVVVVGVEYGHGRRRDVLSDYTFAVRDPEDGRLLTVGKAYSGLTDAEIAQLTTHFLARTLEVHGRRRTVVPDTVLEVAFDSIQPSPRHASGFALRFPRILRIRTDKAVADIDTLETCRRLAAPPPAFVP